MKQLLKMLFLNRYSFKRSPRKNITIFELQANGSRVDLCVVNAFTRAFEIKSEFDSLAKLENKLNNYSSLFEYLYIIISNNHVANSIEMISDKIGIITYNRNRLGNIQFKLLRAADKNNSICPKTQLKQLSKTHLLTLIG